MLNTLFRKHYFEQVADDPGTWWLTAWKLKRVADEIPLYDAAGLSVEREGPKDREKKFLWPIHRMLLGLAFENLIKGLLIAQGYSATDGTRLQRDFTTHKVEKLLAMLDLSSFPLNPGEQNLLKKLEVYVVWMGRYPMPLSFDEHDWPDYGSDEAILEQQLWARLSNHLADVGWKKDADGNRVPMRQFGRA